MPESNAGRRTSFLPTVINKTEDGLMPYLRSYKIVDRWPVSPKLLMTTFLPMRSFADVMFGLVATSE